LFRFPPFLHFFHYYTLEIKDHRLEVTLFQLSSELCGFFYHTD